MSLEQTERIRSLIKADLQRELEYIKERIKDLCHTTLRETEQLIEFHNLNDRLEIINKRLERTFGKTDDLPRICKGLLLVARDHINDRPEGSKSIGEVVSFDPILGWNIVVDNNHSKWYPSEEDILKDFIISDKV